MKCLVDNETKCFCEGVRKADYDSQVLPIYNMFSGAFIIDSQSKFDDFLTGGEYPHVIICGGYGSGDNGAYVLNNDLNLDWRGVKTIQSINNAKIIITGFDKCFSYESVKSGLDYWIKDLEIICNYHDSMGEPTWLFNNCTNLTNIKITCNLTNEGYGGSYSVFRNCTNLTNCEVVMTNNLTGGNYSSYAFNGCTNLTGCYGNGVAVGTGSGYGFNNCNAVSYCKKSAVCTNAVFSNSFASWSDDATYACADTSDGGFNNTDNT